MKSEIRKILVVDDNEGSLCFLKTLLGKSGYEVVSARNGVEALEKLKKNTIDMIVSDILMPEMDGFEFCRECKKDDKLQGIPFVFYTATYADEKDEEFALGLGAEKFIVKPCEISELLMVLETVLEGCRNAAPVASKISINDEETYLAMYNKRLVEKLENKVLDLEKEVYERKQAEKNVRKLSHAIEYSSAMILITDTEGNIEYANPKFIQLSGYSLEESIGKNPRILKSGKTPPEVYKELWGSITSGNEWRGELCNRKKNGELYWETVSISPVKNIEGVITNFIAVEDDITEQKRVQDAWIKSEERYRKLVDATQDTILCDINGVITDWNRSAEELFGYSKDEIIGKSVNVLVPDKYKKEHQEGLERFLKTGEARIIGKTVEVSGLTKEGVEVPIEISLAAQKMGAGQYYFMAIIRDLTKHKQVEEKLHEQKKALEQKNIALSEILGQLELEKKQIKDNVVANAENLLLPIIQKLRLEGESRKYVQLLKKNLQELTSSFGVKLTEKRANLTSREIEICNMIKNGLANKEIARLLNISLGTIEKHRNNIRRKLHIVNKDINLSSFLNTL